MRALVRREDRLLHAAAVLLGRLAELLATVLLRTLGQQVHHATADGLDPLHREFAVAVAHDLDALGDAFPARPGRDAAGREPLAFGDARLRDLDAVDPHVAEQHARDLELLGRRVRDVGRLLAVAQRRVHHLDAERLAPRGAASGRGFRHGRRRLANPQPSASYSRDVTNEAGETTEAIETAGREFVVEPGAAGRRLDVWLAERLGIGRAGVRKLLEAGVVRLDGRPLERRDKSAPIEAGRRVEVTGFAAPDARRAIAEPDAAAHGAGERHGLARDRQARRHAGASAAHGRDRHASRTR